MNLRLVFRVQNPYSANGFRFRTPIPSGRFMAPTHVHSLEVFPPHEPGRDCAPPGVSRSGPAHRNRSPMLPAPENCAAAAAGLRHSRAPFKAVHGLNSRPRSGGLPSAGTEHSTFNAELKRGAASPRPPLLDVGC